MLENTREMKKTIQKDVSLNYLLYLPEQHDGQTDKKWPLALFLHGMGERGGDLELVKKHGLPKVAEEKGDLPFIVVAPQCPIDSIWAMELDALHALLMEVIQEHNVDESRIYLTGLSMGGAGTWHLAEAYPDLFAAIAPVCGFALPQIGFPERIRALKNTPVWAFHGEADDVVPLKGSEELVNELKKQNGNVKFTTYPGVGHDSWTQTYENPELYDWLLKQKLS